MPKKAGKNGTTVGAKLTNEEGHYQLKGELFWKYRAVDSDYVRSQTELLRVQEQIAAFVERTPDLKDLMVSKSELSLKGSMAMKELIEVQKQIEERFSIDLKECSIDDKTGIIHVLKDGQEVPMSPSGHPESDIKKSKKRQAGSAQ